MVRTHSFHRVSLLMCFIVFEVCMLLFGKFDHTGAEEMGGDKMIAMRLSVMQL